MRLTLLRRCFLLIVLLSISNSFAHGADAGKNEDYFLFPRIGVAKAASPPIKQADNTYNITYTVTLKNYGDEVLTTVQVTHILLLEFPLQIVKRVGNVVATGSLVGN